MPTPGRPTLGRLRTLSPFFLFALASPLLFSLVLLLRTRLTLVLLLLSLLLLVLGTCLLLPLRAFFLLALRVLFLLALLAPPLLVLLARVRRFLPALPIQDGRLVAVVRPSAAVLVVPAILVIIDGSSFVIRMRIRRDIDIDRLRIDHDERRPRRARRRVTARRKKHRTHRYDQGLDFQLHHQHHLGERRSSQERRQVGSSGIAAGIGSVGDWRRQAESGGMASGAAGGRFCLASAIAYGA